MKQTNEIGMAIPLLDAIDLHSKDLTADALLTQRKLAAYVVEKPHAHYHFTVKGNQPTLLADLARFVAHDPPDHGRIETPKIWTTTALNGYLDFPHVAQAFAIERDTIAEDAGVESQYPSGLRLPAHDAKHPPRPLAIARRASIANGRVRRAAPPITTRLPTQRSSVPRGRTALSKPLYWYPKAPGQSDRHRRTDTLSLRKT